MKPFILNDATHLRELSRGKILGLLREHKLVLVRGLEGFEKEEFVNFFTQDPARDLVQWDFGSVMEMKENPGAENYLFSREAVPFHWDGAFHVEPSALVFHCVQAPQIGAGGETTFCDAEKIWDEASDREKKTWERISLTYRTEKKAHYGGEIRMKMAAKHPLKEVPVLRYAEPVDSALNPVSLEVTGYEGRESDFLGEMSARLYSEPYFYAHEWQENDLLLADNFSLLHGRNAFQKNSPRHLRRLQLRNFL